MKRFTKHLIVRYLISGGTSAGINLILLSLFYYIFHIYYIYSAIIASIIAFFVSLVLHKFWTFEDFSQANIHLQIGKYIANSIFGLLLNTGFLYILVEYFRLYVYISQVIAGGLVATITFFISRNLIFNGKKDLFSF